MKRRSSLIVALSFLTVAVLAAAASAETVYRIDFGAPDVTGMFEIPYAAWQFRIKQDPAGEPALFFPQGSDEQRMPNTYGSMRYIVLNTPPVDSFEMSWEVMDGWPDGETRSQLVVFGWQDYRNWDFIYLTYTDTSRVSRVVNGKESTAVNEPAATNLWPKGSPTYIPVKVRVTTEGAYKVINVWVNGEPVKHLDGTRIPLSQYKPGRVGIGGLSYSNVQAMFIKNIELKVLD